MGKGVGAGVGKAVGLGVGGGVGRCGNRMTDEEFKNEYASITYQK